MRDLFWVLEGNFCGNGDFGDGQDTRDFRDIEDCGAPFDCAHPSAALGVTGDSACPSTALGVTRVGTKRKQPSRAVSISICDACHKHCEVIDIGTQIGDALRGGPSAPHESVIAIAPSD